MPSLRSRATRRQIVAYPMGSVLNCAKDSGMPPPSAGGGELRNSREEDLHAVVVQAVYFSFSAAFRPSRARCRRRLLDPGNADDGPDLRRRLGVAAGFDCGRAGALPRYGTGAVPVDRAPPADGVPG